MTDKNNRQNATDLGIQHANDVYNLYATNRCKKDVYRLVESLVNVQITWSQMGHHRIPSFTEDDRQAAQKSAKETLDALYKK